MFEQAMNGCWRALEKLRSEGLLKAIGVGVNEWQVCCVLSEILRVKGWLLEQQGAQEAAELAYRKSLETARAQYARTHELRTATSYSHLLQSQRRSREARALLRPVYDWFSEGFETKDLKDAKALLDELGA